MRYSVIIPVYNRPDEVDELLQSLTVQHFKGFEVVVVEDGSSIPCKGVVDRYADRFALFDLIGKLGVKNGIVLWPLRVAVSGKAFTPGGGVEISYLIGKEDTLARIRKGIEKLS